MIKQAWQNLLTNKLRSFLAILGVLVGTASVVTLVTAGQLATDTALAQFKTLGTELLSVSINYPEGQQQIPIEISLEELDRLQASLSQQVKTVAAYNRLYTPIRFAGYSVKGSVVGATETLASIAKLQMESGNFISRLHNYQRFCVLGADIAADLQQITDKPLIGQQVWLGEQIYTVIGVAKPWLRNNFLYADLNRTVIVPERSAKLISEQAIIRNLAVELYPGVHIATVEDAVTQFFNEAIPGTKLFFLNAAAMIASMKQQQRTLSILLGIIGSISLFVGGIGIMNIMLVSVTERRREIGIRKALGAKQKDILQLFLCEALLLALSGGVLGILLGILAAKVIAYFAEWHFYIYLMPVIAGFIVSGVIGVFFGVYPARRAAMMHPIAALRWD